MSAERMEAWALRLLLAAADDNDDAIRYAMAEIDDADACMSCLAGEILATVADVHTEAQRDYLEARLSEVLAGHGS